MIKKIILQHKLLAVATIISTALFATTTVAISYAISKVFSLYESNNFDLLTVAIILISALAYFTITDYLGLKFKVMIDSKIKTQLNNDFAYKLFFNFPFKQGDIKSINRVISNDIDIIIKEYIDVFHSVLFFSVSLVVGVYYLSTINVIIALYVVFTSLIIMIITKNITTYFKSMQQKQLDQLASLLSSITSFFNGLTIIKSYHLNEYYYDSVKKTNEAYVKDYRTLYKHSTRVELFTDSSNIALKLGLLMLGGWLYKNGNITMAGIVAAYTAVNSVTVPIYWFSRITQNYYRSKSVVDNYNNFFEEKIETKDKFDEEVNELRLKNVTSKYFEGDVDIAIRKNETVRIAGTSGSGKTTLLNIILGVEKSQSGDILCNGKQGYDITENIAYVNQETLVLDDSFKNNIILNMEYNKERYDKVTKICNIDDLQNSDVKVLSGGEKQRVAIARALYCRRNILILDEAFKGLDEKIKVSIIDNIKNLEWINIIIFVTHDNVVSKHLVADTTINMNSNDKS